MAPLATWRNPVRLKPIISDENYGDTDGNNVYGMLGQVSELVISDEN